MSWWRGMAQKTKWYKIVAYAKATKVQIILVPRFILRFQARCHLGEWLCCQVFEQSSALHPGSAIIFPVKARGAINQPVSMHYSLFPWLFCILFNKSWSEQGQRSGRCYFSGATAARSAVPPPSPSRANMISIPHTYAQRLVCRQLSWHSQWYVYMCWILCPLVCQLSWLECWRSSNQKLEERVQNRQSGNVSQFVSQLSFILKLLCQFCEAC